MNTKTKQKIWNAMRVLKNFTLAELQHCNGQEIPLKHDTVRRYVIFLERAGYLVSIDNTSFKLLKNTGKLAPSYYNKDKTYQGKCLYDNNLKLIIPLSAPIRQLKIEAQVVERINLIIETFKDKEEFRLIDVTELFGGQYELAKQYVFKLQKQGIVKTLRTEHGAGGRRKDGTIRVYRIISDNTVIYTDLINDIKNTVINPQISFLERKTKLLYELTNKLNKVQNSKDYEELISQYTSHLEELIIDNLCQFKKQFYARENADV